MDCVRCSPIISAASESPTVRAQTGAHRRSVSCVRALLLLGLVIGEGNARAADHAARTATANVVLAASDSEAHDDWQAVPPATGSDYRSDQGSSARANHARPDRFAPCGEPATNPSPEVATIVDSIDRLWGARVQVYQSLAPLPPHASRGGCIFYNSAALAALLGNRMQVRDNQIAGPLLYAIFAHEIGHELHHDFDSSRAGVPSRTKELEADRFAGYTMQRLQVPSSALAPYWSMAGDEFGNGAAHGTSAERVSAFRQGWDLSEWKRPESSTVLENSGDDREAGGSGAVAPDGASGAP
jgi:hypothetical protein